MTDNENRRLADIETTLRSHSETLNQTAVNVATIVEKIRHMPTWPQVEQTIDRSIKPLSDDITTRIELAVSNCQVRNHNHVPKNEHSGSIKIDLKNASPTLKWLFKSILVDLKNASPMIKWIFIVVLPALGYAINEFARMVG